jgi:CRISPR system Cascade subunit CasD
VGFPRQRGHADQSGIVGLLGCALGLERGDPALTELSGAVSIAVRADRPGRFLEDFHTVHADTERGERILSAEGKPRGETIVTRRTYLQDASFLAAISAEDAVLSRLASALQSPRWVPYLGRKSCVPCVPIYAGTEDRYTGLEDAMRRYPAARRAERSMQFELPSDDAGGYLRSDELSGNRQFSMRRVRTNSAETEGSE